MKPSTRPYLNAFTRWRVSALWPVRPYRPKRAIGVQADVMLRPVSARESLS